MKKKKKKKAYTHVSNHLYLSFGLFGKYTLKYVFYYLKIRVKIYMGKKILEICVMIFKNMIFFFKWSTKHSKKSRNFNFLTLFPRRIFLKLSISNSEVPLGTVRC